MKKLVLTVTVSLACVAAFAQGKVRFENDSLHLLYFSTDSSKLDAADAALAGQALLSNGKGSLAPTHTIVVDLYAGTASTSLTRVSTTTLTTGGTAGSFTGANVSMIAGGTGFNGTTAIPAGPAFFQVQAYDQSAGSYAAAFGGQNLYYGASEVFGANASGSTPYYSIKQLVAPASSTWAIGTADVSASTGIAGARGSMVIQLNAVPEPSSFALAGLALAGVAIFRRRK